MRIAKPDVDFQASRQFGVAGHLRTPITGHPTAQCHGQPFHLSRETCQRGAGGAAVHLAENDEARLALDHRAHRRPVEGAVDQVSLPAAGNEARLNVFGAMDNTQCFRDNSRPGKRGAPGSAFWFGLTKRLDHQRLQLTQRLSIDRGIDRLVADVLSRIVGIHTSESGRDLLWRPAPMDQTVAHPGVKWVLGDELPSPTGPPPHRITCLPRNLWIIFARRGTPHQIKPDGAVMPPEKSADLTQARFSSIFRKDHATFLGVQVLIVSFHRNNLCHLGCRCRTSNLRAPLKIESFAFFGIARC